MIVLGVSAFYHDSAAALVCDGRVLAAAQEERFTRKKHDACFPMHALRFCLEFTGIDASQVDYVAFYDKPFLKFERLLETYLAFAPRGFTSFKRAMPVWLREKLFLRELIVRELNAVSATVKWADRLLFGEHHLSHAASAFYPSPFEQAAVLTLDGVGEWATSSLAIGQGNELAIHREIQFPHSLGLLYSAFTQHLGFKVNSGEYKVMGLAPYGEPRYADLILQHLIDVKDDGSFHLNMRYFDYCVGSTMTNGRFGALLNLAARRPSDPLRQPHMDLAASVQAVTELVMLRLTRSIAKETGMRHLCLAGGVALNCVANGKILRDGHFDKIWIQPAAGDAGGAIGAALSAFHGHLRGARIREPGDAMQGSYLGPEFSQQDIQTRLARAGAVFAVLSDQDLIDTCCRDLADGKALGWFQGRMEFGPRALGARSILADARSRTMQSELNLKVKFRESFRPFAPSILRDDVNNWFDLDDDSPYMLFTAPVRLERRIAVTPEQQGLFGLDRLRVPRSDIPAVTHVDYSARVQTVTAAANPRYHGLLSRFKALTGCPLLLNTSFNVRGEPIVASPEDAFRCFMGTKIESLAIGNCYLRKQDQRESLAQNYVATFEKD